MNLIFSPSSALLLSPLPPCGHTWPVTRGAGGRSHLALSPARFASCRLFSAFLGWTVGKRRSRRCCLLPPVPSHLVCGRVAGGGGGEGVCGCVYKSRFPRSPSVTPCLPSRDAAEKPAGIYRSSSLKKKSRARAFTQGQERTRT